MKRKDWGVLLIFAGVLVLTGAAAACRIAYERAGIGVGIIGGADAPTVLFLLQSGAFLPEMIAAAVGVLLLVGGFVLCYRKKK